MSWRIEIRNATKKRHDQKSTSALKTINGMRANFDKLREQDETCKAALEAAQTRYQAIYLGQFQDEDGESATLKQQMDEDEGGHGQGGHRLRRLIQRLKQTWSNSRRIRLKRRKLAEYKRDSGAVGRYEKDVSDLQGKLS